MSLKTRLRLWIVMVAVAIVAALSALSLHSLASVKFDDLLERTTGMAQQVESLLLERISARSAALPVPATLEETKEQWAGIVSSDERLSRRLTDTLASSRIVIEIQILGEDGRVLNGSNPASIGRVPIATADLAEWQQESPWARLAEVLWERSNYGVSLPLGIAGQARPVFQVRVIVSSLLLRNTLAPQIRGLVVALLFSLLAAVLLALLAGNVAFRPLARVGEAIDRIARGETPQVTDGGDASKEVAVLESKLQMLGQQFQGAREDAVQLRGNIEQLLERLEEAVLLFDRNGRLIMATRAAEGLLGQGRWELMGHTLEELFPPSTPLGGALASALEFRQPLRDSPVEIERNERPPARLLANMEIIESFPSRERLGCLVTLRDAETRRQIGTQLDLSTRLAAISRLTGGVAHEIKNPLNSIALHLEVLRARLDEEDPAVDQEIGVISGEITRLDRVVKTFLDFTRPVDLNLTDVDAVELVREVASLVKPEAEARGIDVSVDAAPGGAGLRADRDLVKQALINVVMNGVEAMKNGGRLRINVDRAGAECVISVADNGSGIPPNIRDKIFNLYFTTKGKGSGIGLAMTFRVVQQHNGTIDFTSEEGKGTTFWMRLPVAGAAGETV